MKNVRRVESPTSEAKPAMQRRKAERSTVIYRPFQQRPNRVFRDRIGKVIHIILRITYKPNGEREVMRRVRQMAAGQLRRENGLVV